MAEKNDSGQGVEKKRADQPIEVEELDDKSLEGAAGGFEVGAELADNNDHCTVNNAANC